jgi:purine-binding chemotaxis protein CheW
MTATTSATTGTTPATDAGDTDAGDTEMEHLVCAVLGDHLVAVPGGCVREVVERPALTAVPLAPAGVLGVTALRGDVLCVLDAGPLLGIAARSGGVPAVLVVVAGGRLLGVAVDEVTDVVAVPSAGDGGTVDVDGRLHQLLHPDRLTDPTEEDA